MLPDPPHPRAPQPNDPTSQVDPSPVKPRPAAHAPLPEHVGAYRILRELGHGGMGVVYLATRDDVALNRLVALKLVHRGMASAGVLDRFERERQVLGALNHPNIARLLDGGTSERGEPYFVMEYVEGRPIDEYCDARRLTLGERLVLFRQVCGAVHHAHQNLVVHRDIKPRNILVTADGVPKLLDFGIAKLLNPSMAPSLEAPTQTGLRLMTPEYASPEQVKGLPITTATDVYSLGVVLFELLTGHRPYRLRTRVYQEVERIICEEEPQKPSTAITRVEEVDHADHAGHAGHAGRGADAEIDGAKSGGSSQLITPEAVGRARRERPPRLRRALEGDLDNIVLMALRKEPQRRYASAEQFAEDIRRHLEGHTVIARPDTAWYRTAKFVRRHRAGVAAASAVGLALIAGLTTTWWQWRRAEEREIDLRLAVQVLERERAATIAQARHTWTFGSSMYDGVMDLAAAMPNSVGLQEFVARDVLTALEQLHGKLGPDDDAKLREDIAEMWHRRGNIQGGRRGQSRGDLDAAGISHGHGRVMRAILAAERPLEPIHRANLSHSILMQADLARLRGDRAGWRRLVDQALAMADQAVAELVETGAMSDGPEELDRANSVLATILQSKVEVHFRADELDTARPFQQRSTALRRAAALANPADEDAAAGSTLADFTAARLALADDAFGVALLLMDSVLAERRRQADAPSAGAKQKRRLALATSFLSRVLCELGDEVRHEGDEPGAMVEFRKSLVEAEKARDLAQELYDGGSGRAPSADAGDADAPFVLAVSRQFVGRTLMRLGRRAEAIDEFNGAIRLCDTILDPLRESGKSLRANVIDTAAAAHEDLANAIGDADRAKSLACLHTAVRLRRQGAPDEEEKTDEPLVRAIAVLGLAQVDAGEVGAGRENLKIAKEGFDLIAAAKPMDWFELDLRERVEEGLR